MDFFSDISYANALDAFGSEDIDFFSEELFEKCNKAHKVVEGRLLKFDDQINVALLRLPARRV